MARDIKDPALYRRMSEPLASPEEANKAVEAFFADLRALREKHHIRDVLCVVQLAYEQEGVETVGHCTTMIGSVTEALHMAAVTYGGLRADHNAAMDKAVEVAPRRGGAS